MEDNDILLFDNLESVFYVLIYFYDGSLPWYKAKNLTHVLNKKEIIEIRKKIIPSELCKNFPKAFIELVEKVLKGKKEDISDYDEIIKNFEIIRDNCKNKLKGGIKFKWIHIFKCISENEESFDDYELKKLMVIKLFKKYDINLNKNIEYLSN